MKKVISYQSAYDSLNRNDEPSYAISGGLTLGGVVPNVELAVFGPYIADGYTVIVPDTEGQRADFAAGPEYGMNTLDSIRAAFNSSTVGLPDDAKVAMLGYSGGAIATDWAAELAPTYAPDVNARIVGAAMGGVLVDPAHNLHYVEGTFFWSGVMPMALVGIARAFEIDFTPYLSAYGVKVYHDMQTASIVNVLGRYWGLTWADLVSPAYPTPESLPLYVMAANKLIMGTGGTPTIPMFIGQGAHGDFEWTPGDKPGIGAGDGVMIAGDVRTPRPRLLCEGHARPLRAVRRAQPHHQHRDLAAELDRLDRAALRRPARAAELFVDPAGQLARADSGSLAAQAGTWASGGRSEVPSRGSQPSWERSQ